MKAKNWMLRVSMLSLMLGAQLLSIRAEAQVVCSTLPDCRALLTQTEAYIALQQAALGQIQARLRELELDANAGPGLGDVLRDRAGNIRNMNQDEAARTCRELGTRLPTARELAAHSQRLGACGILSPSDYESFQGSRDCSKTDYALIRVGAGISEPADEFYFNRSGYQRPAGDFGIYWFRSSSVRPDDSSYEYGLGGYSGDVDWDGVSGDATRCVREAAAPAS